MIYNYEFFSSDTFEKLIFELCKDILGSGADSFGNGKDNGKDVQFEGKANCFPSKNEPWEGNIVVQVKHTITKGKYFADNDFSVNRTSILFQEIPKIIKLIKQNELDYYLLVSNRIKTDTGIKQVKDCISKNCGLSKKNIKIIGIEDLNFFVDKYANLKNYFSEFQNLSPFNNLTYDDIAKIIDHADSAKVFNNIDELSITEKQKEIERVKFETKNIINKLSIEYAKKIKSTVVPFELCFNNFLKDSRNIDYLQKYKTVTTDINMQIITTRSKFDSFDEIIESIYSYLINNDSYLKRHKNYTRMFVELSYWNCDIGKTEE